MEQYESIKEEQVFTEESIECGIDSTFSRLERMQDEIITKKISQLEMSLNEIEDVAVSVIKKSNYMDL